MRYNTEAKELSHIPGDVPSALGWENPANKECKYVAKIGQVLSEALFKKDPEDYRYESTHGSKRQRKFAGQMLSFREHLESQKFRIEDGMLILPQAQHARTHEDLQFDNNTALYATIAAQFVEQDFQPRLLAADAIRKISLDIKGANALKIPLNTLHTAADLADNAAISYKDTDYGSGTITVKWIYSAAKLTREIIAHSAADIVADQLRLIGQGLATKMDTDIIAALKLACPTNDSENNYTALGSTTEWSWDAMWDAIADGEGNHADVEYDLLLTNPTDFSEIMQDTQVKAALAYSSFTKGEDVSAPSQMVDLGFIKVMRSSQVDAAHIFMIDRAKAGYIVDVPGIEMYDGRIDGTAAFEYIGLKAYGYDQTNGLARPGAAYLQKSNTA